MPSMAKNLPSKEHMVGEPTHRYLRYILNHSNAHHSYNDSHFIDIALGLSVLNRRAYRQGVYYYVSGVTVHDSNQNVWTKFATAPDNWPVKRSWIRGFRKWSEMNSKAAANAGLDDMAINGKWADFKIFLSSKHRSNADGGESGVGDGTGPLLPITSRDYENVDWSSGFMNPTIDNSAVLPAGEWEYSRYISQQDADGQHITLLGEHVPNTEYCLTHGFATVRQTVRSEDPELPAQISTDYLNTLFDDEDNQNQDVIDDLDDENDYPPYNKDFYPCVESCIVAQTANSAGAGAVTRAPGFVVPFGLLEVITNSATSGKVEIVIELAAGNYNGVAAARVC